MRIGIVSGYFNPIHTGHLDYIQGAKEKCEWLYVIVNNDNQVKLKGSTNFMDEVSRLRIINALEAVHMAILSIDEDHTVVNSIQKIYNIHCDDPFVNGIYFMNGGDRAGDNTPEAEFCKQNGIHLRYNVGGEKTTSSSQLLGKVKEDYNGE